MISIRRLLVLLILMGASPIGAMPETVEFTPVPFADAHALAVAAPDSAVVGGASAACDEYDLVMGHTWVMPVVAGSPDMDSLRFGFDAPVTVRPVVQVQEIQFSDPAGVPVRLVVEIRQGSVDGDIIASGSVHEFAPEAGGTWTARPELHFDDWTGRGVVAVVRLDSTSRCSVDQGPSITAASRFRLPVEEAAPTPRIDWHVWEASDKRLAIAWKSPFGGELDQVHAVQVVAANGSAVPVEWQNVGQGHLHVSPRVGDPWPMDRMRIEVEMTLASGSTVRASTEPFLVTDTGLCFKDVCQPEGRGAPAGPWAVVSGVLLGLAGLHRKVPRGR